MNTLVRRHLPIGIQTFAKIREGDYYSAPIQVVEFPSTNVAFQN